MKKLMVIFMLLLPLFIACNADAKSKKSKETPAYDVVAEYIRSLSSIHNIQQAAVKERDEQQAAGADNEDPGHKTKLLMNSVRSGTRVKLELYYSIRRLQGITIKRKQLNELIPITISFYKEKIKLFDEMSAIAKQFLDVTPKTGVDYSKFTGRMPEITATLEYLDESIFQSMVMVFALLIDEKPNSEGLMGNLSISTEQRDKLIWNIDTAFGDSLNKENKNWTVASAALLKSYLQKDYKCTDEWQPAPSQ